MKEPMGLLDEELATERAFDDVRGLSANVRLDGLPEYPRFAAEDFERAFARFCILTAVEEPFGELQESQRERDVEAFPDLASFGIKTGHFILPEEQGLDFVLKVTGHSRGWVASWNYRVALNDIASQSAGDVSWFLKTSRKAYEDAVRYVRSGER
jgi:hypothetical protein